MKNRLFALLIAFVAPFALAQSEPTLGKSAPREHRGFYNSVSFAAAYNWYNSSTEELDEWSDWDDGSGRSRREIDKFEYNGGTFPMFEFKFGMALANLVTFQTVFNLGFFMGTMDYFYEEYDKSCRLDEICAAVPDKEDFEESSSDAYSFRSYLGFGTTVYPFRDKESPLNGFFVGGSFGYVMFVTVINGGNEDACGNGGPGFEVELGKDRWINDHLSIGVGLGYAHSNLIWKTISSHSSDNVISISFRMTRG